MSTDAEEKRQFLHRGRRYLGLWVLPDEHDAISEASFRLGKTKHMFIMEAIANEVDRREWKDLSEKLFECKVEAARKRANSYSKIGRDFSKMKRKTKTGDIDPNGSVVL